MITRRQIALVHVAKARTGMSEIEYRAMLEGFGVASSKELNRDKFDRMMRHFEKIGFKGSRVRGLKGKAPNSIPSSKEMLRKKVRAMMAAIGVRDAYVDAMARHMFGVDSWLWLDADRLHKIVAALTYHQRRRSSRVADNG